MTESAKAMPIHVARQLKIATGSKCSSNEVSNCTLSWAELTTKLEKPVRTKETFAEFVKLGKSKKATDIKDVGYFVGGHFANEVRSKKHISQLDVVVLDMDFPLADYDSQLAFSLGGMAYCVYSTHSHSPQIPRLRLVFPLSRTVSADEYEPLARKLAGYVGMDYFDDTTFQVSRPMFWPSVSKDGEYVYQNNSGDWVNPDEVLGEYDDWTDALQWPVSSRHAVAARKSADKAQDPLEKSGFVGAFCKAYSIQTAIDEFIPDVYTHSYEDRYSYSHGSTVNGVVVYDDKFLFSHHGTDPIGGRLVNAFDLVRLHLYGDQDEDAEPGTPVGRLPSYTSMKALVQSDPQAKKELIKEGLEGFDDVDTKDAEWLSGLEFEKGKITKSLVNAALIVENDPEVKGAIAFNQLCESPVRIADTPWCYCTDKVDGDQWQDIDDLRLRSHIATHYKVEFSKDMMYEAVHLVADSHTFHPVHDYLNSLEWDGVKRLETMLHRHLGVQRSLYTDAVSRKMLCAAVARVFNPGIKFDYVPILEGSQGKGKSTFIKLLAKQWFGDNLSSFKTQEAVESMMGKWIVELSELQGFGKAEQESIKAFISRTDDRVRLAYGRRAQNFPRRSIFIGTTNDNEYLRDDTGNRRFWPIKCEVKRIDFEALKAEVDQIWAEAVVLYRGGEKLYLDSEEAEKQAVEEQKARYAESGWAGIIEQWLNKPIPSDYFEGEAGDFFESKTGLMVERDRTCAAEIWTECLGGTIRDLKPVVRRQISSAMRQIEGWEGPKDVRMGRRYGRPKGYQKCA